MTNKEAIIIIPLIGIILYIVIEYFSVKTQMVLEVELTDEIFGDRFIPLRLFIWPLLDIVFIIMYLINKLRDYYDEVNKNGK